MGPGFQSGGAVLAASVVGLFFACAGFNKLFSVQRSREMIMSMERVFGPNHPVAWAACVGLCQMFFGLMLLMWCPYPWARLFAAPLLVICLVAWFTVGWRDMLNRWRPVNFADHISCWLWDPNILLSVLCIVVILG